MSKDDVIPSVSGIGAQRIRVLRAAGFTSKDIIDLFKDDAGELKKLADELIAENAPEKPLVRKVRQGWGEETDETIE